ncbi:MAG TPA: hypothetical protein VKR29_11070, partial [Candidatus Binataceae bacterium]|nr:hypothetical protein [Candidatus Binataceae bacterium]
VSKGRMSAGALIARPAIGAGSISHEHALSSRALLIAQAALWCGMFILYFCSPVLQMSDSQYTMLTAESIIRNHTPDLSGFRIKHYQDDLPFNTISGTHAYQLVRVNGRLLYGFPHGTSILSLPFVGLMDAMGVSPATRDGDYNLPGEVADQKLLAALLMASLTVIFLRTSLILLDLRWSIVIALGAGLATPLWSTASRGMWSHSWEILLCGIVIGVLLSAIVNGSSPRPILLATLLSWMFFVRPTAAADVLCVSVLFMGRWRRDFLRFATTGTFWLFAFIAYSERIFGSVVPFYYAPSRASSKSLAVGLMGNLVSPSRGLFVFCPILLVVLVLVVSRWRALTSQALALIALLAIALITLSAATYPVWWGGYCYGPRFLTDAIPWFVLLAILALAATREEYRRLHTPTVMVGAFLLVFSIAINARGALAMATFDWNDKRPIPALMFDWSRPQFLAGLIDER